LPRDSLVDGEPRSPDTDDVQPVADQLPSDSASDQQQQQEEQTGKKKMDMSDDDLEISRKPQRPG